MRLCFVLSSLWLSGGVQVVVEYANRLVERGHRVSLVAPRDTTDSEISARLAPAVTVHASPAGLKRGASPLRQLELAVSLARTIPAGELVIATHTPTIVPALLATLGQPTRRLWLYMDYAEMFERRPVERALLRHGPAWFNHIMTLSESSRQDALRSGAKRVSVVGLGLTWPELFVPRRAGGSRQHATLMYLGDARPRKGLHEFLCAAEIVGQSLPALRLLIVSKEALSIQPSLPYELVLKPKRQDLPDLYRQCDVFVSSSWSEGFGLPPLEAMACGAPVVLTDSGGVREYARDGENCLVVPARAPEHLAAAISKVLTDPALADTLHRNGPITAAQFTWERALDRFEQVLQTIA